MIILTVDHVYQIVSRLGLRKVFLDLIGEMKQDFARWEHFHKSPRHAIHYPTGVIELMPTADEAFYAFKYVNGHPGNPLMNKSTVMATGQLSDAATGEPLLFSEMTLLTAFRTAAASALAGEYLQKPGSRIMAMIGTGGQSEFQALAFHYHGGIGQIRYFDRDEKAMKKFDRNLKALRVEGLEWIPCRSLEEALEGSEVITTLTAAKAKTQVLTLEQVKEGMFLNAVGGDCPGKTELDERILHHSKVVVEYLPQTLIEGEIQNVGREAVYAELWELVSGKKPGRNSDKEITCFDSVGFAIEDYSILKLFYRYAQELKLGEHLKMVPDFHDPKDVFSGFCG